jgi:hypothetical protein
VPESCGTSFARLTFTTLGDTINSFQTTRNEKSYARWRFSRVIWSNGDYS